MGRLPTSDKSRPPTVRRAKKDEIAQRAKMRASMSKEEYFRQLKAAAEKAGDAANEG